MYSTGHIRGIKNQLESGFPVPIARNMRSAVAVFVTLAVSIFAPRALAQTGGGCGVSESAHQVIGHEKGFVRDLESAPRNAIRPHNLKWELPIAAATGLLIAEGDQPAANRIQGTSIETLSRRWSNIGLYSELAIPGIMWGAGCLEHKPTLRDNGLTVLTAIGTALAMDGVLKVSFNRQYPYTVNSRGEFWEGGRSFPSGHATISFAFASAIAQRYPHNRWIKWGAYALAAGVALSRYPGKKHYFSDILVGSTLGYVVGSSVASH